MGVEGGVDGEPAPASEPASVIKVYSCDSSDVDMDLGEESAGLEPSECDGSLASWIVASVIDFDAGQKPNGVAFKMRRWKTRKLV